MTWPDFMVKKEKKKKKKKNSSSSGSGGGGGGGGGSGGGGSSSSNSSSLIDIKVIMAYTETRVFFHHHIYCDIVTWSIARQWLGKHIFMTTDMHAIIKDIDGNGVLYVVQPQANNRDQ
jgi:hypothetical protein